MEEHEVPGGVASSEGAQAPSEAKPAVGWPLATGPAPVPLPEDGVAPGPVADPTAGGGRRKRPAWAWPWGPFVLAVAAGALGWGATVAAGPPAASAQESPGAMAPQQDLAASGVLQLSSAAADGLKLARVRQGAWAAERELAAEVASPPEAQAVLSAPWAGRVVALPVQVGQAVAAGQVLAELASAELGLAEAEHLKAIASLRVAREELRRMRRLAEAELASRREVEEAELREQHARVGWEASREALRGLGLSEGDLSALAASGRVRGRQALRAPIAGTVVARPARLGEAVGPSDPEPLVALAQLGTAWVSVAVPERDLPGLKPGAKASVRFVALGGAGLEGRVARLAPTADPRHRALVAWVALPNPSGQLRPGLSAQVRLGLPPRQALILPPSAILREPGGSYAYKALGGGRFEERRVEVGESGPEGVALLSGLALGDEVVTEGAFDLRSLAKASGGAE